MNENAKQAWASIEITPEPSPEELAALTIALARLLSRPGEANGQRVSAWAMAGRRESLVGQSIGTRPGWGREVDLVSRW